jgi:glycosyltransferase involved in cell wall biosynthesis
MPGEDCVRILMWDVHGGYTDSLLAGSHDYLFLPRDRSGRGGLTRFAGSPPLSAREATAEELRDMPPDLVLLQRLEEIGACRRLLGHAPGADLPAIFLEHNTPKADIPNTRHPLADANGIAIVHVTHFNELFWDCGQAPTRVIEHGIADPGLRYTGELERLAFVVNESVRRWRTTGTDLLRRFEGFQIDAFGIDGDLLPAALQPTSARVQFAGNLAPTELNAALARRRVYLHLNRWTSLGLSLISAMLLGMPVVVLDTTEASRAVPADAGALSTDVDELIRTARRLVNDVDEAARRGRNARQAALERYGLKRFLDDWDEAFLDAVGLAADRAEAGLRR